MTRIKLKIDAQATAIADMFNNTKNIQHTDMNADTTKSKPVEIDI